MKFTLGFSPCPNDTFIFDALIHKKIDTEGIDFEVIYEDVETLNLMAFNNELDITKLSFHAFAFALKNYGLLDAGSALGHGVGPLLISRESAISEEYVKEHSQQLKVAIPGVYTTANFLMSLAFPSLQQKELYLFSEIEDAVSRSEIDLGLIIHESRFTYQQKGLHKITDLGNYWEKETGLPIPLGGIVGNRRIPKKELQTISRLIRKSIEFAFDDPQSGLGFIKSLSQEMEEDVIFKHINLYVNNYSLSLGQSGRDAVTILFDKARSLNVVPSYQEDIFI